MATTEREATGPSGGALFDEAIAVRHGARPDEWHAELRDEFSIVGGHPNGGYLLAVMGNAAILALGEADRHVVSATTSYISPPVIGAAIVRTEVQRRGKTASQLRTVLVQDDRPLVETQMTLATLDAEPPAWSNIAPPVMPTEEECAAATRGRRFTPPGRDDPPLSQITNPSFDPATFGFASGDPSGAGELRLWLRFLDDQPFSALSLLFAIDAMPPAAFEAVPSTGWVPTLSLTAYIRALPGPGPLRARFRAGVITGGRVDETCEVWDSRDALVAQSTQLAAIRVA